MRCGGRCAYTGCNELLWRDDLTNSELTGGLLAHIVADVPGGPRGDPVLSPLLAKDPTNIMLICHPHHTLIDKEEVVQHPIERLREMKREHEERIELLTSVHPDARTTIIALSARIGASRGRVNIDDARRAVLPARYARREVLDIDLSAGATSDDALTFWDHCVAEIHRQRERISWRNDSHYSVFAFAPVPLLITFGRLLGDKTAAEIFQLHRDRDGTWQWPPDGAPLTFDSDRGTKEPRSAVALVIEVSAPVDPEKVAGAMTGDYAIYRLASSTQTPDAVRNRQDPVTFAAAVRRAINDVVERHGTGCDVHVFAALPVSLAVAFGRALLPKAHPRLHLYEYTASTGYRRVVTLSNDGDAQVVMTS
jgi:hypothetical protein